MTLISPIQNSHKKWGRRDGQLSRAFMAFVNDMTCLFLRVWQGFLRKVALITKRDNGLAGHEASTINIKDGARDVGGFVAS